MNFFNGDQLTKYEIKQRLNKMNISFDNGIIDKKYYASLYNKAILIEENRVKIKDELTNDNSLKNIRRSNDSKPISRDSSDDINSNSNSNSNGIKLKQKYVPAYPVIKEVPNEEERELESFVSGESQNDDKVDSNIETSANSRGSTYLSHGASFGLGLSSMFAYQNIDSADVKALVNKLPSMDQIVKTLKNIFIPLKNWSLLLIDIIYGFIKPYAEDACSQFYSYISKLQFDDVALMILMSFFAIVTLLILWKALCKRNKKKRYFNGRRSYSIKV